MRISDWSSDVCSSDLLGRPQQHCGVAVMAAGVHPPGGLRLVQDVALLVHRQRVHVGAQADAAGSRTVRSEEHTSELQSLMRISYAVFCLKKKTKREHSIYNKVHRT